MATIIQLSDTTYLNLDTVTILRCEGGQWRVWFSDPAHAATLTADETAVLLKYLHNHTNRVTYQAVRRQRQAVDAMSERAEDHPVFRMTLPDVQAFVAELEEKYRAWTLPCAPTGTGLCHR